MISLSEIAYNDASEVENSPEPKHGGIGLFMRAMIAWEDVERKVGPSYDILQAMRDDPSLITVVRNLRQLLLRVEHTNATECGFNFRSEPAKGPCPWPRPTANNYQP